jgi:DNA-damage-inducible protein D
MKENIAVSGKNFEDPTQINQYGAEYWSARGLQSLLGYSQWRRFEQAIERAVASCKASGNPPDHHFASADKPITGRKGAVQVVDDSGIH